jgi:hypothetical protein
MDFQIENITKENNILSKRIQLKNTHLTLWDKKSYSKFDIPFILQYIITNPKSNG